MIVENKKKMTNKNYYSGKNCRQKKTKNTKKQNKKNQNI